MRQYMPGKRRPAGGLKRRLWRGRSPGRMLNVCGSLMTYRVTKDELYAQNTRRFSNILDNKQIRDGTVDGYGTVDAKMTTRLSLQITGTMDTDCEQCGFFPTISEPVHTSITVPTNTRTNITSEDGHDRRKSSSQSQRTRETAILRKICNKSLECYIAHTCLDLGTEQFA